MTPCNHPALHFSQGGFYLHCTHCQASWVAFKRDDKGKLTFDHKRIDDEVTGEARVKV